LGLRLLIYDHAPEVNFWAVQLDPVYCKERRGSAACTIVVAYLWAARCPPRSTGNADLVSAMMNFHPAEDLALIAFEHYPGD
jgi:hypothetical protein